MYENDFKCQKFDIIAIFTRFILYFKALILNDLIITK